MKAWLSTWAFGVLLACPLVASPPERAQGESGLKALDAFNQVAPLDSGEKILGMVGFYGEPEPVQWLILSATPEQPGVLRESVFARGKVLAERKFTPLPAQDLPHLPILRSTLKVDSGEAFRIAEDLALRQKRSFDSVHFQLRVRDLESEPVWMLNLINSSQVSIGVVYLSASTGKILRESWAGASDAKKGTKVSAR